MRILRAICALLALLFIGCNEPGPVAIPDSAIPSLGTPNDNEIWFTTNDNNNLNGIDESAFNATITDIEYSEFGVNIIRFDAPLTTIGAGAFDARGTSRNLNNISLPNTVTTIGERAFYECSSLECITLGPNIKSCGMQAFDNCQSLYSIHIASIADWAQTEFANETANPLNYGGSLILNDKKIKELVLPAWVSHIGSYAFCNYNSISSVTIPASVKSIGKEAFSGCDGLSKVNIEDVAAWCKIEFATALSNPLSIAGTLLVNGVSLTTLSLEGVDSISPRAFQGCNNIASLRSDSSLRSIGEEAFRGSLSLSSVELGEGVTTIESKAFMGCTALKSITIPDCVTAIGTYAFGYCRNLTSVTIGKGVTAIGDAAFCDCSNLKAFYGKFASADNCYLVVNGVLHSFAIGCGATEFAVPDSVSEIGNSAFYNCSSLTSVTIGSSVTAIEDAAFEYCSSLKTISIPDSVTTIGESVFNKCNSLTSATIGNGVTSIGSSAFYNCSSLTEVYCKPTIPPTGGYNMFNNNAADRKIYVPAESLDDYKNHEAWSRYADAIMAIQ